ncbi:MAG: DUF6868 family protein [Candidatus Thiodiazotropha endolucinida]|uniref:DUF6868 domain-containing protein n=1 Tax=Candidatus Thiodiazotropha endolucinida TaxID=1655433 RepID=A0A7Z0VPU5_9GAMM|nr:hypothetical protein [Candidatus Thiodiazotropha endolucinida]ODJ89564.1 hypothetical protein CODIS_01240 [Candidatus Thiodiazotropha endolucinida]
MNIQLITDFFMWCTLINGGLLILWTLFILFAPELGYKTQSRWIAISRANFDQLIYLFLGIFKLFFIFFNLIPFLALLIIG